MSSLAGWLPIRVFSADGRGRVEWARSDGLGYPEPFFEDSVRRLLGRPFNLLFRRETPLDALAELGEDPCAMRPRGLVFHTSRCGSTLLARMLAAPARSLVLSEPDPLDAILRSEFADASEAQRCAWLRGLVAALSRARGEAAEHVFVKLDAWSVCDLPLLRRAFPETPWVFLYRDPLAVLHSQMRRRGVHMVPGMIEAERFGLARSEVSEMSPEEYCSRVLGALLDAALRFFSLGGGLLLDYSQLPAVATGALATHFGVSWTREERAAMAEAARFDAKAPGEIFAPAPSSPGSPEAARLAAACERWAAPSYRALEALRARQAS